MTSLLITGATGKQGGAVINSLLAENADVEILAVTRDAESSSAQKLLQKSSKIKLVIGDLNAPAGIFANAKGIANNPISGVFSVQMPMSKGQNVETEERQGKALIDESIKEGVKHFVYTSVDRGGDASIDNPTNIPHFISKHRIEQHLFEKTKNGEMTWTVLRPVFFFDNITNDFFGKLTVTAWDVYLQGKPLQGIAVSDIGYFGAQTLLHPDKFRNQALSLAGDELTYERMQKIVKSKTGQPAPTTFSFICYAILWLVKDLRLMFNWFYEHGYRADIDKLRKIHPKLKNLEDWLEEDSTLVKR